ncbi:uncharacterized protein LOC141912297 [Tubulanus polymorphus]|uniref:uncharacterized protein LOC141912297 n=1 Tax=Tubulanus polymorphus TaxID=672921 RepID=UPI003DA220B3
MGKSKDKKKAKRNRIKEKQKIEASCLDASTPTEETPSSSSSRDRYTVDQILEKVQEYMDTFNYELAQKFCQRALEIDADNLKVLETSGILLLELGNPEGAKQCFGRAVELSPHDGYRKYMYLGQLFDGVQAVQCFQKGIELMTKTQAEQVAAACASPVEGSTVTNRDISSAHCTIAELYMTDLCFEENAEDVCKMNIARAIEKDAENPEAFQAMASFQLVKQNQEEAKAMIQKSVSLWLPKLENLDKEGNTEEFDPIEPCSVSYQQRTQAAQILIEVEDYETCIKVLDSLLEEDDEIVQTWYLLGWANYLQGDDYKGNARFYLNKADEVAKKVKCDDEPMLNHISELLTELGPAEEDEDAEEETAVGQGNGDNEDEDVSSSSDEEMDE